MGVIIAEMQICFQNVSKIPIFDVIMTSYLQMTSFSDFENCFKRFLTGFPMDVKQYASARNAIKSVKYSKIGVFERFPFISNTRVLQQIYLPLPPVLPLLEPNPMFF